MKNLMQELPQASVLGLPVHITHYLSWLTLRLMRRQSVHVVTLNAEMAMVAEKDEALADIIHRAELVIPDGAGVVLYLNLRGHKIKRCPGIELSDLLLQEAARQDQPCPVFFYGGKPGVSQAAAGVLQHRMPGLTIAATHHGYGTDTEQQQILQALQDLQPAIVLVGLGVPRQEFWIAEHRHLCPRAIWIGVGGSFDIWAGVKTRAPGWLRNNNLEWVYRLYQEPWRWKRMLALPKFAWKAIVYRGV